MNAGAINDTVNCRVLYDDNNVKASAAKIKDGQLIKKDKNQQQMSAPRLMEVNKNIMQQKDDQSINVDVDQLDRYQLKRRISCNYMPELQKKQKNQDFDLSNANINQITIKQQVSDNIVQKMTEFAKPINNLNIQHNSQVQLGLQQTPLNGNGECTVKNTAVNDNKIEQYEFFVSESLNNVSFKWQKKHAKMNQRANGSQNQVTHMQRSQFNKKATDQKNKNNSSFDMDSSKNDENNQIGSVQLKQIRDKPDQIKQNETGAGINKHEDSESVSKLSVKDQIKMMVSEFGNLTQNFEQFILKQQRIEAKLKDLEREKVKQRVINDQLLYQLMKSEENKQVFEKLMTIIFQFIKDKTVIPKKDESHANFNNPDKTQTFQANSSQPSNTQIKLSNLQIQLPQKIQLAQQNADANMISEQIQQLQLQNNKSSSLMEVSDANQLQSNVLDGMVSQLRMIKSTIYNEQASNSQQQQKIQQFESILNAMIENLQRSTNHHQQNQQKQIQDQSKIYSIQNHNSVQPLQTIQQQIQTGLDIKNGITNIDQNKILQNKQEGFESSDNNKLISIPKRHLTALTNIQSSEQARQVGYPNFNNLAYSQEITMPQQQSIIEEKQQLDKSVQPLVEFQQSIPSQKTIPNVQVDVSQMVQGQLYSPEKHQNNQQLKVNYEPEDIEKKIMNNNKPNKDSSNCDQQNKLVDKQNEQNLRTLGQAIKVQQSLNQNTNNTTQINQSKPNMLNQTTPTNAVMVVNQQHIDSASQMLENKFDGQNQTGIQTNMKPSSTNLQNVVANLPMNLRRASIVQSNFQNVPYQFRRASVVQTYPTGSNANNLRRGSIIYNPLIAQTANNIRRASYVQNNISNLPDMVRRASIVQNQLVNLPENLRRASIVNNEHPNMPINIRRPSIFQMQPSNNENNNVNVKNFGGQTTPLIQSTKPGNMKTQIGIQADSATSQPNTQFNQYVMTQVTDKQNSGGQQQHIQPMAAQSNIMPNRGPREQLANGQQLRSMSISNTPNQNQQAQKQQSNFEMNIGSVQIPNSYSINGKVQTSSSLVDKFGNMQKYFEKGDTTLINFTENQQNQLIHQTIQNQSQQPQPHQQPQ